MKYELKIKYEGELNSYKRDYSERELHLATEYDILKESYQVLEADSKVEFDRIKAEYENAINEKDKVIISQRSDITIKDNGIDCMKSEMQILRKKLNQSSDSVVDVSLHEDTEYYTSTPEQNSLQCRAGSCISDDDTHKV